MIRLLVVDDSALVRKLLGQVFVGEGDFEVAFARTGLEALAALRDFKADVVTLDVEMPQMSGLECLDRIMIEHPCPVVMVSSATTRNADITFEALQLGAVDFVPKPAGAVSLHMDEWAPSLVARVRNAAATPLRPSLRLRERVQHRIQGPRGKPGRRGAASPDEPPPHMQGEGLVLIGASTGGPPALEALLGALPQGFPWPILVAQHMPAAFTGPFARRLDSVCAISVVEVTQPVILEAGRAHIGRGDSDLVVTRRSGRLVAMAAPEARDYPWHPSTERLVASALDEMPATQLIGILLTGMGHDGAGAMTRLRQGGGRTIAEAEATAVVWGMPGALVKAGGASQILALPDIAEHLTKMVM